MLFVNNKPLICSIMKMEAPYVIEWIAWHRINGFDLMVADNCTAGPQTELLKRLAQAGFIHYLDARHLHTRPQLPAYNAMLWRALRMGYRYVGFLDADEFFEARGENAVPGAVRVVTQLEARAVDAIGFYWCTFGSGGELVQRDLPVIQRFSWRARSGAPCNRYIKSFCKLSALLPRMLLKPSTCVKNPHYFHVSSNRYVVDGVRNDPRRLKPEATWNTGRIRHYAVKSREEYLAKRLRGDVYYAQGQEPMDISSYWKDRDLNDEYDPIDESALRDLLQCMNMLKKHS